MTVVICSFECGWEQPGQNDLGSIAVEELAVGSSQKAAHLNPLTEIDLIV